MLRTLHIYPLTLSRNSPTSQRLVHFAATLSTQTAIFLHYFVFPSVILLSYVVVHDHTFPEGSSANDGISSDQYLEKFLKLHLPGIDGLVEFVNAKGRGWHVFKKDLPPAYRQIPIDPQDYPLLRLYIDGSLFFHTALPFGLRSASMICQRTTKALLTFWNLKAFPSTCTLMVFTAPNSLIHLNSPFNGWTRYLQNWVWWTPLRKILHHLRKWFVWAFGSTLETWLCPSLLSVLRNCSLHLTCGSTNNLLLSASLRDWGERHRM